MRRTDRNCFRLLTALVLCTVLLAGATGALAASGHAVGCTGNHSFLLMDSPIVSFTHDEYDSDVDYLGKFAVDVKQGVCGGFWDGNVGKLVVLPAHYYLNNELKEFVGTRPLEGGYAGIFDFTYIITGPPGPEDATPLLAPLEMIIVPDTYQTLSYLGNPQGTLKYVSLPCRDSFRVSGRDQVLFNNCDGITFLVVEGSGAHRFCIEQGLQYAFRQEYCQYARLAKEYNALVFDAEAFYRDTVSRQR